RGRHRDDPRRRSLPRHVPHHAQRHRRPRRRGGGGARRVGADRAPGSLSARSRAQEKGPASRRAFFRERTSYLYSFLRRPHVVLFAAVGDPRIWPRISPPPKFTVWTLT